MAEITFTTPSPLAPRQSAKSGTSTTRAPKGYAHAEEVNQRAAASPKSLTIEEQAALIRLNKIMAKGEPLESDVPRGYYLNFRV